MTRKKIKELEQWFFSKTRKSLIMKGARQVGKTWLIREFVNLHKLHLIEINFEREPKMSQIFESNLLPEKIIEQIEVIRDIKIDPSTSLLFFDEIQECPIAITALKHFTDTFNTLAVVAAGSYLGMLGLKTGGISQPIGYVDEMSLYPMCFEEFLLANDSHPVLLKAIKGESELTAGIHEKLLTLYKQYLYVGGMPEVVKEWVESSNPNTNTLNEKLKKVRELQKNLLSKYKFDFAKYHPRDAVNIGRTWELVAESLTKSLTEVERFIFKNKMTGKRDYNGFSSYFAVLEACGLIHRSYVLSEIQYPLKSQKKESIFKCFYFDTGILLAELDYEYLALESGANILFKGPIAENFVAIEFSRAGLPLFSYLKTNSSAELEFLLQKDGEIIPVEIKNNSTTAKSLNYFIKERKSKLALKFSNQPGSMGSVIHHYPIYRCSNAVVREFL